MHDTFNCECLKILSKINEYKVLHLCCEGENLYSSADSTSEVQKFEVGKGTC